MSEVAVADTKANGSAQALELLKMMQNMQGTMAGTTLVADDDIKEHDGSDIIVPRGMTMEHLEEVAGKKKRELNKVHTFKHLTDYRPDDGAHAAAKVIKQMFGLTVGKETVTMFGTEPPAYRTIHVAHNRKMDVPWGKLEVPALPGAVFELDDAYIPGKGPIFYIKVESPKKHKAKIEAFFSAIDDELRTGSIYRGQALLGAHSLQFMNVAAFKSGQIVFSDDVQRTLDASVFSLVEHTAATIEAGLPTKRAVLAFGPYGTGKSSLGLIAAQRATAAGWTFLSARAGRDDLGAVLQTANLYSPSVVFIEDIESHTPRESDKDGISELLDLFDGIGTKSSQICVVLTTNHIEQVPAGMLRPGRLDYCVEIAGLDRPGIERLIKAVVRPELLDASVDYDAVFAEMASWQPAWVRATADRAQSFALARTKGALSYSLTTDDLIGAAKSLQPQLALMESALEGYQEPELDTVLKRTVVEAVENLAIVDRGGDQDYALTSAPKSSSFPGR